MLDLIVEGFGSLRFGCTLALLVPGIGVALAVARHAPIAALAFISSAGLVGWARFADLWFAPPETIGLIAAGAAVAVSPLARGRILAAVGAAVAGLVAGWLWVPCVGEHLSQPLNEAAEDPIGNLLPIFVFVIGTGIPLIVLAALPAAWPAVETIRDHPAARWLGVALGALVGISIATGWYSEFIIHFAPS